MDKTLDFFKASLKELGLEPVPVPKTPSRGEGAGEASTTTSPVTAGSPPRAKDTGELSESLSTPTADADYRKNVPTVSQITQKLKSIVEGSFGQLWVRGEISNFRKSAPGHAYFILKDATAQMRAVAFRSSLSKVKFALHDGMEVLAHGKIQVYEPRGEYQITLDALEPMGLGPLQLAFEQMKKKLQQEGLFEASRKKKLPFLPTRIGFVTSPTGAAIRDMLTVGRSRFPDRHYLLFPAMVQGERAAPEIVRAIAWAQAWNLDHPDESLDVLVIGRGGGSLEDLWPFNEEMVARAIASCPLPTVSAVGHEIDFTIADFVADLRAPTPSAAMEMILPKQRDLERTIQVHEDKLRALIQKKLDQQRLHLGHLAARLMSPVERLKAYRTQLETSFQRMTSALRAQINLCREKLSAQARLLDSLSPLAVLHRGYSLTQSLEGKILESVEEQWLVSGARLRTSLRDGEVISQVEKTTLKTHKI